MLADDETIRRLNRDWRKIDKPTNVLSFPMVQPDLLDALTNSDDGEALLGERPDDALITAWDGTTFGFLPHHLITLGPEMDLLSQRHLAYPVLHFFRSGERKHEQMSIIAQSLQDNDISDLAAWYSKLKVTVEVPQQ